MRKLQRPPAPQQFEEHAQKWMNQWLNLRVQNPRGFTWYTIDGRTARDWALPVLKSMSQGHCSFCDAFPLEDRAKIPVEHLRPKSHDDFAHLALEWTNLYYCCGYCQSEKHDQWEDDLIAPDELDYSFQRYFAFDYTNGCIWPNPTASTADQERARVTIRLFGLDSVARCQHRMLEFRKFSDAVSPEINDWAYPDYLESST